LEEPLTTCIEDIDCRLRTRDCCECGGNMDVHNLIALNERGLSDYPQLVCDPDTGCLECEPLPPTNAVTHCENGRCVVEPVTLSP
jgi:hypothetical protein